jgi:hypothetical protein
VLWLNYGDKYWGGKGKSGQAWSTKHTDRDTFQKPHHQISGMGETRPGDGKHDIYQAGDLLMLPARVAIALQADGWILRDDVIWAKAISFNDKYSGSTMPESVNGTRWERCRVKVKKSKRAKGIYNELAYEHPQGAVSGGGTDGSAEYKDCPGCEKCEPNGGLVLRRGSWRCTKAHEHIFQFVKTNDYFCDMEAVREDFADERMGDPGGGGNYVKHAYKGIAGENAQSGLATGRFTKGKEGLQSGRNLRNVWTINPRGYKEAHYATYPEKLVEPCIKVSTSKKGVCPKCGCQWARIVDSKAIKRERPNDKTDRHSQGNGVNSCGNTVAGVSTTTLGWKATCQCDVEETVPAIVCDPFMGSGTTAVVAAKLGRNYFGCEINPEYKDSHIDERVREAETGVPVKESRQGQGALFT